MDPNEQSEKMEEIRSGERGILEDDEPDIEQPDDQSAEPDDED